MSEADYLYGSHPSIGKLSGLTLQNFTRLRPALGKGYSFRTVVSNVKRYSLRKSLSWAKVPGVHALSCFVRSLDVFPFFFDPRCCRRSLRTSKGSGRRGRASAEAFRVTPAVTKVDSLLRAPSPKAFLARLSLCTNLLSTWASSD